jgi:hypothetical protein
LIVCAVEAVKDIRVAEEVELLFPPGAGPYCRNGSRHERKKAR